MNKDIFFIFLDIDGVLDNQDYWDECYERHHQEWLMSFRNYPMDPKCLNNLMILFQKLQEKFDVKIILSSTWRLEEIDTAIVECRLAEYGMKLSGATPNNYGGRGSEIEEYLNAHKCKDYLVLDDNVSNIIAIVPEEKVIKTEFKTGFDKEKLKEALTRLKLEE